MSRILLLGLAAGGLGLGAACECRSSEAGAEPEAVAESQARPEAPGGRAPKTAASSGSEVQETADPEPTPEARRVEGPVWTLACEAEEIRLSGRLHPDAGVLQLRLQHSNGSTRTWSNAEDFVLFMDVEEHVLAFAPEPSGNARADVIEAWAVPRTFRGRPTERQVAFEARVLATRFDRDDMAKEWKVACTAEAEGEP